VSYPVVRRIIAGLDRGLLALAHGGAQEFGTISNLPKPVSLNPGALNWLKALPCVMPDARPRDDDGHESSRQVADDYDFLSFDELAVATVGQRMPNADLDAMRMVILLHRVARAVVYDLESTVHRPAGWSWSAFRLMFTIWTSGPLESSRAAELSGMSRAAVSSLTKTLSAAGLLQRTPNAQDGRSYVLSLTGGGVKAVVAIFAKHNLRETEWANLISAQEREMLNAVLVKLAHRAHEQDWVSERF
jgi:DNA-binding MarR family transcriptional regulator